MKKTQLCAILILVLGVVPFQLVSASGTSEVPQKYEFQNFDAIEAQAGIQVEVLEGENKVELVQTPKPERLDVHQSGGTLILAFKPLTWSTSFGPTKFKVWVPRLRGVTLSGGAGAQFSRTTGGDLTLELSGGSHAEGSFEGDRLNAHLTGGSLASLQGSAKTVDVSNSGGAQFHARDFVADQADVRLSGGAGAQLRIVHQAQIDASGGATLEYSGRPSIRQNVSGGATVRSVGD